MTRKLVSWPTGKRAIHTLVLAKILAVAKAAVSRATMDVRERTPAKAKEAVQ